MSLKACQIAHCGSVPAVSAWHGFTRGSTRGPSTTLFNHTGRPTELRAQRRDLGTISAKVSTYTVSTRTGTRAPAFLDQVDLPLYDREPGWTCFAKVESTY